MADNVAWIALILILAIGVFVGTFMVFFTRASAYETENSTTRISDLSPRCYAPIDTRRVAARRPQQSPPVQTHMYADANAQFPWLWFSATALLTALLVIRYLLERIDSLVDEPLLKLAAENRALRARVAALENPATRFKSSAHPSSPNEQVHITYWLWQLHTALDPLRHITKRATKIFNGIYANRIIISVVVSTAKYVVCTFTGLSSKARRRWSMLLPLVVCPVGLSLYAMTVEGIDVIIARRLPLTVAGPILFIRSHLFHLKPYLPWVSHMWGRALRIHSFCIWALKLYGQARKVIMCVIATRRPPRPGGGD